MDWEAFYNSFRKPDFIPGYEIQNRLGGGAFGDVYKARKQSIGKPYAIKFLKIEDDSQRDAVERELEQVRHFAAIDHPNLVTIEDMGTVMGVPFLIMGYAGEDTLARRYKRGSLPREEALLYFVQACRGVLALHDRRLVHFDLKPSNIFLKGDIARVGDYGLSKLLTDGRMTLSFGRGTPQYMAPEILRNRADHRADIYSLGVILYEALVDELPFQTQEGGLVLREDDGPPGFPEHFPARLRPAVECCLRLDPDDRFQDVGELLEAIDQTARQGDSVRLENLDAAGAAAPLVRTRPSGDGAEPVPAGGVQDSEQTPTPRGDELRQTAADLARGAVEVARGVWDGLRSREENGEDAQAGSGVVPAARRDDAPLQGPPKPTQKERVATEVRAVGAELKAAGAEIREIGGKVKRDVGESFAGARERLERGRESRSAASRKARALVAGLGLSTRKHGPDPPAVQGMLDAPAQRAAGTIPVPPRVEGGALGTVIATVVLGLEVLVSLVGNLLRGLVRGFKAVGDRLLIRSGGVMGRAVRFFVFVLLMGALGFAVMMVGMAFLHAIGVR
ncbi:MAG: protein kinase [bacterium]|nr:protein kinase [bacterium]